MSDISEMLTNKIMLTFRRCHSSDWMCLSLAHHCFRDTADFYISICAGVSSITTCPGKIQCKYKCQIHLTSFQHSALHSANFLCFKVIFSVYSAVSKVLSLCIESLFIGSLEVSPQTSRDSGSFPSLVQQWKTEQKELVWVIYKGYSYFPSLSMHFCTRSHLFP